MSAQTDLLDTVHQTISDRYDAGYRAWLDKLTTLSLGALTLLVSLQSTYVPQCPRALWLLVAVWSFLALSVLSGLLALFGEAQAHRLYGICVRDSLLREIDKIETTDDSLPSREWLLQQIRKVPYYRPKLYVWSAAIAALSSGLAVISLAVFASLNLWITNA